MSERMLSKLEAGIILAILAVLVVFLLSGCNGRNCEYKRWDAQGNLREQVRMGQANFLYWFGMKDFTVDTDQLDVSIGTLTERNDPNSVQLSIEALKTIGLP